jgi:hypothetical protein
LVQDKLDYDDAYWQRHHHVAPFHDPVTGIWIEVHHGLFESAAAVSSAPVFQADVIASQSIPLDLRGITVKTLAPEYQWLYMVSHWASDLRPSRTLSALQDAVRICQVHPNMDWNQIRDWAVAHPVTEKHAALFAELMRAFGMWPEEHALPRNWPSCAKAVGRGNTRLLKSIAIEMGLKGRPQWNGLGLKNITTIWNSILSERRPLAAALATPVQILFPRSDPDRFRLKTLQRRLRSLLFPRQVASKE